MSSSANPNTAISMKIDGVVIRASFWKNEPGSNINSILKMQSRCWDVQVDATPEELFQLSSMLEVHARQVQKAIEELAAERPGNKPPTYGQRLTNDACGRSC